MKTLARKRPPKTLLLVLSPAIAFSVDAFLTPSLFTSATRRAHPFASIHTTGYSSSFGSSNNSNNKGELLLLLSSSSSNNNDNDNDRIDSSEPTPPVPAATISQTNCWNPMLRRVLASISTLGMAETAYITYEKLYVTNGIQHICGTDGEGCGSVLDGPYATLHLGNAMEIPLSALGFLAYFVTTALALAPLFNQQKSASTPSENLDTTNRILLLSLTTAMGTFSVFLMSLLFGVLHTTCPFCILSAILSISLATLSWVGGMIPPNQTKQAAQSALASFTATTIAALLFFFSVDEAAVVAPYNTPPQQLLASTSSSSDTPTTVRAGSNKQETNIAPPPITTTSTDRTLSIASDLKSLHAKMYGAYWCSHCYEQKQRLGAEAFTQIQYVECAREGLNSQRDLCNARDVPGYPTWEIDGKLYPGERELDELEDLVRQVRDTIEQGGGGS